MERYIYNSAKKVIKWLKRWVLHVVKRLSDPDGWKVIGKFIGGLLLLMGTLHGIRTYHMNRILEYNQSVDNSYHQLIRSLGNRSQWVRIGAIARLKDVMLKKVPITKSIRLTKAVKIAMLGDSVHHIAKYHDSGRRLIHEYLRGLSNESINRTRGETSAVIDLLGSLGKKGWYYAEKKSKTKIDRHKLKWIWEDSNPKVEKDYQDSFHLMEGVDLDSISLAGHVLSNANFRGASMKNSDLSKTKLDEAILSKSNIRYADLQYANLKGASINNVEGSECDMTFTDLTRATMEDANLEQAFLSSANLSGANMQNIDLTSAHATDAKFKGAILQGAVLDSITAVNSDFTSANLSYSSMNSATLVASTLDSASLQNAALVNADLRNSTLRGADLSGADLRKANLNNVDGLRQSTWNGANIGAVEGIKLSQVEHLIEQGAVRIPNDKKWRQFKQDGRPLKRWRDYFH